MDSSGIYAIYIMVHTIYIKQRCWGKILILLGHNDNIRVINSINNVFIILNHYSINIIIILLILDLKQAVILAFWLVLKFLDLFVSPLKVILVPK
jgi:hypothetical protein